MNARVSDDVNDKTTYHQRYHDVQKSDFAENHINMKASRYTFRTFCVDLI